MSKCIQVGTQVQKGAVKTMEFKIDDVKVQPDSCDGSYAEGSHIKISWKLTGNKGTEALVVVKNATPARINAFFGTGKDTLKGFAYFKVKA